MGSCFADLKHGDDEDTNLDHELLFPMKSVFLFCRTTNYKLRYPPREWATRRPRILTSSSHRHKREEP